MLSGRGGAWECWVPGWDRSALILASATGKTACWGWKGSSLNPENLKAVTIIGCAQDSWGLGTICGTQENWTPGFWAATVEISNKKILTGLLYSFYDLYETVILEFTIWALQQSSFRNSVWLLPSTGNNETFKKKYLFLLKSHNYVKQIIVLVGVEKYSWCCF